MAIGPTFPEVLKAAQAGADWALELLYRELAAGVLGYLRGKGAPEPEDAASEVFVGIVRGISSFSGDERAFRAWAFSIAHRRLIDQRRWRSRHPETTADPDELVERLSEPAVDRRDPVLPGPVARAVLDLTPDQSSVLLLRVVADLSVAEVASVLSKSEGAVKTLQRRALRALAKALKGQGVS